MKIRVLSDLHLDYNTGLPFRLKDTETFTVICGDISGYCKKTAKWLNRNVKQGVFVSGNHMVYNRSGHSLQYQLKQLENMFPLTAPISFLNNGYKVVDDVVFVGGTLWTDYCLFGSERKDLSKWYALRNMNDFKYARINLDENIEHEKTPQQIRMRPEDCEEMFHSTIAYIDEVCHRFPDKKIVVVTHHAPSEQSISIVSLNDCMNPAYASNLEEFILERPNIKLWCHGHIHSASDYNIGNCRVVCNPRGYAKYFESVEYTGFNKDLIIEI